jgi:O-antigen/teichoic acid export membrane protein
MIRRVPASLATVLIQGADMGAQLAATVIIGRVLGPEALGSMTIAFVIAGLVAVVLLFGTTEVAIQLYGDRERPAEGILGAHLALLGGGSIATLLLGAVFAFGFQVSGSTVPIVVFALATLVLNGVASVFNAPLLAKHRTAHDLPGLLVLRALLVVLVWWGASAGSIELAVLPFPLCALALAAWRRRLVRRWVTSRPLFVDRGAAAMLWRRGARVGLGGVFGNVSNRIDAVLLQVLAGERVVGLYGAMYRIVNGVTAGMSAVALALYPALLDGVRRRSLNRAARLFIAAPLVAGAGILIATLCGADVVAVWLYGESFAEARPILRALLFAAAAQSVLPFVAKALIALGLERALPRGQLVAAALNVALNVLLIPGYGALGAAWATVAADGFLLVHHLASLALPMRRGRR